MRKRAVIFDVDGTLCDTRPVLHYVDSALPSSKRDFHSFHAGSIDCPPHPEVLQIYRLTHEANLPILVVTGREAKWSDLTTTWLARHGIEYEEIYMRPDKDYRPDAEIKLEILGQILKQFEPVLAVDDRSSIIDVWRAADIPTIHVSPNGTVREPLVPVGIELHPLLESLRINSARP